MTKRSLDAVATALLKRGFQRVERPLLSPDGRPSNHVAVIWWDPQGHPQGGWSLGPALRGQMELLQALGDAPGGFNQTTARWFEGRPSGDNRGRSTR